MSKLLYLTVIIFLELMNFHAAAQNFPKNETGKVVYTEVAEADSLTQAQLYRNAADWLGHLHKSEFTIKDSVAGKLVTENEFSVYTGSGVLKKLSGKFTYQSTIEVKNNRYRYFFTNFIYHEYKADRYHNILPTGATTNLEEEKALGWQKLWDKHRKTLHEKILKDIASLKIKMLEKPKTAVPQSPKKEVRWED